MHASVEQFVNVLVESPLLAAEKHRELAALSNQFAEPQQLAEAIVHRGWLTRLQADYLLRGESQRLIFGPYVLLELLGSGGMGHVYKARHQLMNRTVALKLIRPEFVSLPEAVSRFHREIQAAARLSHPHVVVAYDAAQHENVHFLVTEYVNGKDLAQELKERGTLPVGEACDWIRQAALGLAHAHDHGLVHRDVKPSNLLRSLHGDVKVADLGLARLMEAASDESPNDVTRSGVTLGTPDFLAPEQAANPQAASPQSDIYSLGCTLYCLLTGKPPFPGGSLADKLIAHRESEPVPVETKRSDVPLALGNILRRMMAKAPSDRYASAYQVADDLAPFCHASQNSLGLAQLPTLIVPPGDPAERRNWLPITRRWLLTLGAAAALLMLIAVCHGIVVRWETEAGTLTVEVMEPDVDVTLDAAKKLVVHSRLAGPIELAPGEHEIRVTRGSEVLYTKKFRLDADDQKILRAVWRPKTQTTDRAGEPARPSLDRQAAEWIVRQGWRGTVRLRASDAWVKVPGDESRSNVAGFTHGVPDESFDLIHVDFSRSKVTTHDLQRLANFGLHHLQNIDLSYTPADQHYIEILAEMPALKRLNLLHSRMKTSTLKGLRALPLFNDVMFHADQIDDDWDFLRELPTMRTLEVAGAVTSLGNLAEYSQLRTIYFHHKRSANQPAIRLIQGRNPHCRIIPVVERDPVHLAALQFLARGAEIRGRRMGGGDAGIIIREKLEQNHPYHINVLILPRNMTLTPQERELLTVFWGMCPELQAAGLKEADLCAAEFADNTNLERLKLMDSDLTDAGLQHLQHARSLRLLDVSRTCVTKEAVESLRRHLPLCDIRFGD